MNFNAVRSLLKPMSDEQFEELLHAQSRGLRQQVEDSVSLEEVSMDRIALQAIEAAAKISNKPGSSS